MTPDRDSRCPICGTPSATGACANCASGVSRPDPAQIAAPAQPITAVLHSGEAPVASDASVPPTAPQPPVAAPEARLGRYLLQERLGAGGMGVVWKAHDPVLGRTVALKQIHGAAAREPEARARLLREARLAARLRHPNVVGVHDVCEVGGIPILAMEFVPGRNFAALLEEAREAEKAGGPPPPDRLRRHVEVLADAAAGVAHAHELGVLHRDLKPANVLVDAEGRGRVADFGLAREVENRTGTTRITRAGFSLGTPAYMSPEQAAGDPGRIGPASDVWSLGAVLYEVLTGRTPFESAGEVWEIMRRVQVEDPAPPSLLRPGIPDGLEAVCLRALARDPGRRTRAASAFEADLRRWLRGEPVQARRPGAVERAGGWAGRQWRMLLLGAALLAAAGGALVWAASVRARAIAEREAALETIGREVLGFEEAVFRMPLSSEALREVAVQPFGLLEGLVRRAPEFGPAYAWRGAVKARLGVAGASADFDRAVELAPDRPVVWYLRARETLERYASARGLPGGHIGFAGLVLQDAREETPEERNARARGLADLERMLACDRTEPHCGEPERRLARVLAALYAGRPAEALALVEGLEGTRARRLRGMALFHLQRFAAAAAELRAAAGEWPEHFDTWQSLGQAELGAAEARRREGGDPRAEFARAEDALSQACRLAPEAGWVRAQRGMLRTHLAGAMQDRGEEARVWLRGAIEDFGALDSAAAGMGFDLLTARGAAWTRLAQVAALAGDDPEPILERALADLDEAVRRAPRNAAVRLNRGAAWAERASRDEALKRDAREAARRAVADYEAALRLPPDLEEARIGIVLALAQSASARASAGEDADADYAAVFAGYEALLGAAPADARLLRNRGLARQQQGDAFSGRGRDPRAEYRQAVADLEASLRAAPGLVTVRIDLAAARARLARSELEHGGDPRPEADRALMDLDAVLAHPGAPALAWENRGLLRLLLARARSGPGEDARAHLRAALADFDEAGKRDPGRVSTLRNRALAASEKAQWEAAAGADPKADLARARADADEVVRRDPATGASHLLRGQVRFAEATLLAARGAPQPGLLADAESEFDAAVRLDPASTDARMNRGSARLQRAVSGAAPGAEVRELLVGAIADYDECERRRPGEAMIASNRSYARWSLAGLDAQDGEDPRPALSAAVADAETALRLSPSWPTARVHRAQALASRGEHADARGEDGRADLESALADYRAAATSQPSAAQRAPGVLVSLGRYGEAIAAYEELLATQPAQRAWAEPLLRETRLRRQAEQEAPWLLELLQGADALRIGACDAARERMERGLGRMEATLEALPEPERSAVLADRRQRTVVVTAHVELARLLVRRAAEVEVATAGEEPARLRDKALDQLERAVRRGLPIEALTRDPALADLRKDPRWPGR